MKIMSTELKLQLIILLSILIASVTLTLQSIHSIRHLSEENIQRYTRTAYANEERELKNYITIALQTINLYYKNIETKNTQSLKENELQQQKVLEILSSMRFGESGYFWIIDKKSRMIMHPTHSELNGQDLSAYKDSNGVQLFDQMVKIANQKQEGFLTYLWPREGYATDQPKRSYIKLFQPWEWIIGTGEYTGHIEKQIEKMKIKEHQEIDTLIIKSITLSTILSIMLILSVSFIIKKVIISPIMKREIEAEVLKKSAQEYRTLAENIPDPIFRYDTDAKRIYVNPAVEKISGMSADELLGKKPTQKTIVSAKDSELVKNSILKVVQTGKPDVVEVVFNAPDGRKIYYQDNHIPEFDSNGKVKSVLTIVRDITAEKMLATREEMFRTLAENSPDIIMRYDEEGTRIYANPAFSEQTGIPQELVKNHKPETQWGIYFKMLNMNASEYQRKIQQIIKTGESETISTESIILSTGQYIAHEVNIVAEKDTTGKIIGALAIGRNVTERKNIEKRIEFMSHHDPLTGFANRILAKERTAYFLTQAKQKGNKVALLFIDLDEFKTINDSLGHSMGDIMLKMVALRLEECITANDTISREGGDEFLIILSNINDTSEVESIANKLMQEFKQPFNLNNNLITASASIGIALYPDDGENFEQLLQSADAAMYKAKEIGKNNYCFYTQQMKDDLIGSFHIQNDLKNAIENKEFVLHYQPQIDLKQNKIIGVEALIRWQHPTQGLISPINFISIAESSGLIVPIGEWVMLEACKQAALWNKQGKNIVVAVNVSAVQFKRGNLNEIVKNTLQVTGLDPQYLELELTESILIHDTENVLNTIKTIKELGIKLSIDDFGTGYSSLSYLKRFAVDKLKIDQSFIRDLLNDQEDASIVKTIIQMAKSFNLRSIAEGVENSDVLEIIKQFGCDEVQGYHFAKPMALNDFETYYHNYIS